MPLSFVAPGLVPPGVRVASTVRSIDVAPSIFDLAGLPAELQFRGLLMLRGEGGGEDRACFGETGAKYHIENNRRERSASQPGGPERPHALTRPAA